MNETSLRWKGRIGSLKGVAAFVLFFAVVGTIAGFQGLDTARKNSTEPLVVTIGELARGEIGRDRYVSITGEPEYEAGYYEEDEDTGRTTRTWYYLVNYRTGDMILIEHPTAIVVNTARGEVTITGMTRRTESDLQDLIEGELADLESYGLQTNPELFVKDGARPPSVESNAIIAGVSAVAVLLSLVTFFLPGTVFAPHPVDRAAPRPQVRAAVKATGRFVQLTRLKPSVEFGKRSQKFNKAVANVITLAEHTLMIYIHHIVKTKTYGVTVRTTESDWGIVLEPSNVIAAVPGKLYSWKEKWGVRFEYPGRKGKPESLLVLFDSPGVQAGFVELIEGQGFTITTPEMIA